jgi:type IV secretory pathway component VirB8
MENNLKESPNYDDIPQFVIVDNISKKFLSYDPAIDRYNLEKLIKNLEIWDYHWDKECMPIPVNIEKDLGSAYLKFQKLNKKQLELLNEKFK